jgi:hypothetical protein
LKGRMRSQKSSSSMLSMAWATAFCVQVDAGWTQKMRKNKMLERAT